MVVEDGFDSRAKVRRFPYAAIGGAQVKSFRLLRDARDLLRPIYHWFTEGFDAPDLKDAKTLLNELTP